MKRIAPSVLIATGLLVVGCTADGASAPSTSTGVFSTSSIPPSLPTTTSTLGGPTLTFGEQEEPPEFTEFADSLSCDPNSEDANLQVIQAFVTAYNNRDATRLAELIHESAPLADMSGIPHLGEDDWTGVTAWARKGLEVGDRFELVRLVMYDSGSVFWVDRSNDVLRAAGIETLRHLGKVHSFNCSISRLVLYLPSEDAGAALCRFWDAFGDDLAKGTTQSIQTPEACSDSISLMPFIPHVSVDQGHPALELTFLDGTSVEIEWPESLDLLSGGVTPYGWARIEGVAARDFYIRYGDVVDVIAQFGPATQIGGYSDGAGGLVTFWRLQDPQEPDYLGFQFNEWAVLVYDYRTAGEGRMTDESRELWATHFHGSTTDNGFLFLSTETPLTLARAGEYPSPMSMTLWSPTGLVFLIPGPCQPGFTSPIDEDDYTRWCDASGRLSIEVSGPPDYQQQVNDQLRVVSVDIAEVPASGS